MKIEFNSASESPALTGKIDIKEKQEKKKQKQTKTKTKRQVADDSKVVYKEKFIMKGKVNEKRNPYQKIPSPLQSSLACLDVTRHVIIV